MKKFGVFCLSFCSILALPSYAVDGLPQSVWVSTVCDWGNTPGANANPTTRCSIALTDVTTGATGEPDETLWPDIVSIAHQKSKFIVWNPLQPINSLFPVYEETDSVMLTRDNGFTKHVQFVSCAPVAGPVWARTAGTMGDSFGSTLVGFGHPDLKDSGAGVTGACQYTPTVEGFSHNDLLWYLGGLCSGSPIIFSDWDDIADELMSTDLSFQWEAGESCNKLFQGAPQEPDEEFWVFWNTICFGGYTVYPTLTLALNSGGVSYQLHSEGLAQPYFCYQILVEGGQ